MAQDILIAFTLLIIAFLYSAVGHGGASGYSAILALFGLAAPTLKPAILILNIAVSLIGFVRFAGAKKVDFKILMPLLAVSIPFAYWGGKMQIPNDLLEKFIGIALLVSAGTTFLFDVLLKMPFGEATNPPKLPILLGTGSALGFLAGVTGIGGGVFLSPLMLHFKWAKIKEISGIAAGFILFNSMAGLIGQIQHKITLPANFAIWIGAVIIGGFAGSYLGAKKLDGKVLRIWLALIVFSAGFKLLLN